MVSQVLPGNPHAVVWLSTLQQVNSSRKVVPNPRNVEGNDSDCSERSELTWNDDEKDKDDLAEEE